MQRQKLIQNRDDFPNTHCLIYRGKSFPIKIDFFKISSQKFSNNQIDINSSKDIHIFDDDSEDKLNLSDDSINNFINYIHHVDTFLTNENVAGINYLAKRYEVPSLIKATEEYISEHHDEIVFSLFSISQNDPSFDTTTYENVISDNIEEYVNNDNFVNFHIPILYRILEKSQSKGKNINNKSIVDFLFKCLDKYKRKASVLFSFIDLQKINIEQLNKLLTYDPNILDFHFINSSLTKTLYELQNETISRVERNEQQQKEFMAKIEKMFSDEKEKQGKSQSDKIKDLKGEISKLKEDYNKQKEEQKQKNEKEIKDLKDEINKLKEDYNKEMEDQKQKNEKEIKDLKNEINKLKGDHNKEMEDQKQKNEKEIKDLKDEINKLKEDLNLIKIPFTGDHFKGIITYLGEGNPKSVITDGIVNVTSSSVYDNQEQSLPKHVVEYDNSNSCFYSKDEKNSWIMFDFKERKVKITDYTIRTNCYGDVNHWHLQNWCIEGSENNDKWIEIDSHSNDKILNKCSAVATFKVKNMLSGYFRYVRLRQTDVNTQNNHEILLSSIEFFGSIRE